MSSEHVDETPSVSGPVGRWMGGIVVRDGRYHWSGAAYFLRTALLWMAFRTLGRLTIFPGLGREDLTVWDVVGLSWPRILPTLMGTVTFAGLMTLVSWEQRRRFNASAPAAPPPLFATRRRWTSGID